MKIARKPTPPELTDLARFIFYEELEESGLAWWAPLWPALAFLLKRWRAIKTVKQAAIRVFDDCWMEGIGYVDGVMIVRWQPDQMNETADTFIWLNGQFSIALPETKFWQRAVAQRQALEPLSLCPQR